MLNMPVKHCGCPHYAVMPIKSFPSPSCAEIPAPDAHARMRMRGCACACGCVFMVQDACTMKKLESV